jgi:hypothetical protein
MKKFLLGIAKDVRATLVGLATLWLLSRIPQIGAVVMPLFWSIVPSQGRTAWLLSTALFLAGFLCLFLSYRIHGWRLQRQIANGTVIEAIGPHVPQSGASGPGDFVPVPPNPGRFRVDRLRKEDL